MSVFLTTMLPPKKYFLLGTDWELTTAFPLHNSLGDQNISAKAVAVQDYASQPHRTGTFLFTNFLEQLPFPNMCPKIWG